MVLVEDRYISALKVKSVMNKNLITVIEDMSIEDAARIIIEKKHNALPFVNKNKQLKGILTTTDIIEGFIDYIDSVDYKFWG